MEEYQIQFELIKNGLRNCYLLNSSQDEFNNFIVKEAKKENLMVSIRDLPFNTYSKLYFISKNDLGQLQTHEDVGKALGYHCWNFDITDFQKDRIGIRVKENINNRYIYTEVCSSSNYKQMDEIYSQKIKEWNQILPQFLFSYEIFHNNYHFENIKRMTFEEFKENLHVFEELNLKYNYKGIAFEKMKQDEKNFKEYKMFYKIQMDEKIKKIII